MNLVLAVFWLVLAVGLFVYPVVRPRGARLDAGATGIPLAWIAVLLCCYNLVRWWMIRVRRRERDAVHRHSARTPPPAREDNPDFDSSERPGIRKRK